MPLAVAPTEVPPAEVGHQLPDPVPGPGHGPLTDDPAAELQRSRRALYDAFWSVPYDPAMPCCTHCVSVADVDALGGRVADLPPDVVGRFLRKAGTTWGRPVEVRRIAPRALDLAAESRLPVSRAVLWDKLRWARWTTWPAEEVEAVRAFLLAEWVRLLASPPRPAHTAHGWLRPMAGAGHDLTPFLLAWHRALGEEAPPGVRATATAHLVGLLVASDLRPDFPESVPVLVADVPSAAAQLTQWLTADGTAAALHRATSALTDQRDAKRGRMAVERLVRFRAAVDRRPATTC